MKKLTTEEFILKAKGIHGDKYDYSKAEYTGNHDKITIVCKIHGEFETTPSNHLSGHDCPKCSYREKYSLETFINKSRIIHNNKYNYSKVKYESGNKKVLIVCPEHGEFWQTPHLHLTGCGCPKCKLKKQTVLYDKLKASFSNYKIIFEASKKDIPWIGTQRIDIYIFPDYNIAIEYDGELHFSPIEHFGGKVRFEQQQTWDLIKQQKCSENHCALFRIKYNYSEEDYNKLVNNIKEIIKC